MDQQKILCVLLLRLNRVTFSYIDRPQQLFNRLASEVITACSPIKIFDKSYKIRSIRCLFFIKRQTIKIDGN